MCVLFCILLVTWRPTGQPEKNVSGFMHKPETFFSLLEKVQICCDEIQYNAKPGLVIWTWIAWDYILVCVCVCVCVCIVCMYVWCACVSWCVCVYVCAHRDGSASCSIGFINSQRKSQVACTHLGKQQVWALRSLSTYWAVHQPLLQWDRSSDTSNEYYVILN